MRLRSKAELAALAALAYGPFLLSDPGKVSADSKQDLYLDPGALLARTTHLWDPEVGAGTVPHQGLGYLFPTAPWFWLFDRLGAPDWVAQRLWWGTLTLAALLGARWLFRLFELGAGPAVAGALVYGCTPYQLAFTARMSVLLLPWAALPWLVGLTMRATRRAGWRDPALVAGVLVLAGGVNASSLLLVGVAPLLWVLLEVSRRRDRASVLSAAGRIGLLALGVSTWWLVGLRLQGAYGLPVLQLTENVRTVSGASTPGDVLRGLGNWFFYGRDRTGWSLDQAEAYASDRLVIVLTYAVPAVAIAAGMLLRWTHRAYFGLLVVVGTVIAVGAWPVDDPTPYGRLWRTVATDTSLGLAFRNTPRVVPVVVLGLAGLLAAAVAAVPAPRWRPVVAAGVGTLALAGLLPVWQSGGFLTDGMMRPEQLPDHWLEAAAVLDEGDHDTRILEVPGSSFAAYRWGTTVDPITPALTSRPYLAREVLPSGTAGTATLLDALDRRFQLGILEPDALAPMARLFGAGTISFRGDLEQAGRFDTPPASEVWEALRSRPDGLAEPRLFGREQGGGDGVPAVALFDVESPQPIVRTAPASVPVVLAGDGDGLVDAAAAGLLDGRSLVLSSAALDDEELAQALDDGAALVVTDSHRRRIQTWFYALRDTRGPTEAAGQDAEDPTGYDFRLDPFPGAGDDSRSVVEHLGGTVTATGGRGPEAPEDRAAHAVDGDPGTSWRVTGEDVTGHRLKVRFDEPVEAGELRLVPAPVPEGGRALTSVRITIDGASPVDVALPEGTSGPDGVVVPVPAGRAQELTVELTGVTAGAPTPVGLAELQVADARVEETVRLPVDLLRRAGTEARGHSLDIVLTRLRVGPSVTGRADEESRLDRSFELPGDRQLSVRVAVRGLQGAVPDVGAGCRDDLLQIDGQPIGLRPASSPSTLESCTPVSLDAGSHRLVATRGSVTGIDLDRVVLSSDEDGGPAAVSPRGSTTRGPEVTVVEARDHEVVAQAADGADPFWFVLGQSHSDGWEISVSGGRSGAHVLADGYANGWIVTPDGSGPVRITVTWEPQRLVGVGLATSAATLLLVGFLLWRTRAMAAPAPALGAGPRWAWRTAARPTSRSVAIGTVSVTGLVGLLVAPPVVALLGVVGAAAVALGPPVRLAVPLLVPVVLLGARVLERPSLAWLAVLLLLSELVHSGLRRSAS